ncbi:lasso peptide isopeptide bond-forming cyclase [Streptomyces thermogriseus]|uniref:asparagine synthase (glutamine-hydrolyzing) n=1 Tax=Streptomyces thermogriseus TaxID=75292 RepID=A0ABP4DEL9_9ACTN
MCPVAHAARHTQSSWTNSVHPASGGQVGFLVLPDNQDGAAVARATSPGLEQTQVIPHASGRPWIVGAWNAGEMLTASVGRKRLALLGCFGTTSAELLRALSGSGDVAALDAFLRSVPGSYHAIVSFDGEVRVQGSLSGVHEVFHATVGGVTCAADRPDTLAARIGGDIDAQALVGHLLSQQPWPLSGYTVWRGVECLAPGHYLRIRPDGAHRAVRWWSPPSAELTLAEGARRVRNALDDAVAARARNTPALGCDFSGGMDSTSLAFLASRQKGCRRLVTIRREAVDPAHDDAQWALRAAAFLPGAEFVVLPSAGLPLSFTDQLAYDEDLEAPYPWSRVKAVVACVARQLAARAVPLQLTGHGGDELFSPAPSFYHALAHSEGLRSVRDLRVARSMYRWPLGAMLSNLLRKPSYRQWLITASMSLTKPVGGPTEPFTGWGAHPRLPPWATPEAVEMCAGLLREAAARGTPPHSPEAAQHEVLQAVRQCGTKIRLTNRLTSRFGVAYHAPYLDDQVVSAALSVRLADRVEAERTKPVLATAMREIVPDALLDRTTKGEASAEVYAGARHHKAELLALTEDMRLARLGLVDDTAVRAALLAPHPVSRTFIPVVTTLACEVWLRSVEAARTRMRQQEGAA